MIQIETSSGRFTNLDVSMTPCIWNTSQAISSCARFTVTVTASCNIKLHYS